MAKVYGYFFKAMELIVLLGSFFMVNASAFLGSKQFPDVTMFTGKGWDLIPSIALLFAMVVGLLILKGRHVEYFQAWLKNPALVVYLIVAALSLVWSVYIDATLYKLIFLIFATVVGSYIAIRYEFDDVITIVTWMAIVSILLSVLILIFVPNGIMYNYPYTGSWRGLFWHRNHSGSLMAYFNALFLYRLLRPSARPTSRTIFELLFYLLSLAMVIGSKSATGVVISAVLHFVLLGGFVWLKWGSMLKPVHYYSVGAALAAAAVLFFLNIEFFFGLLGRSANMTGRIPLWQDLLSNIWAKEPWLGYGYGALWMQKDFRYLMMERQGWTLFPVFFSDNGFIDILLNLGLAGFAPFAIMLVQGGYKSVRSVISSRKWDALFLPMTFVYILVGNLSYSFLLEVDQLVWMLLVIIVFMSTRFRATELMR